MDITRRCDYALRILEAAYLRGDQYVSVSDISEQEDIPYAFARSIQHDLVKGGRIKTVRGARGGLARDCDPAQITLLVDGRRQPAQRVFRLHHAQGFDGAGRAPSRHQAGHCGSAAAGAHGVPG